MARTVQSILKLEVPIIVRVGERRLSLAEAIALTPGSIIELPKRAEEQLDLMVNNIPVAQGYAVKVGENFGLGIEFIGDVKARIEALAGHAMSFTPSGASDEDAEAAALAEQFLNG